MQNPGRQHWSAVKHILRYLKGTSHYGIQLGGRIEPLHAYSDSDWAGDLDTRRSQTGYILFLNSGPISWNSKLQPTVALSSTEAEYMALSTTGQEIKWLRSLLQSFNYSINESTKLFVDNEGALKLAKNPVFHSRSKHIDVRSSFYKRVDQEQGYPYGLC